MSPVSAPADKRFRRAHVKPARRRRLWNVLRPIVKAAVVGSIVAVGLYEGGSVVAHARALQIDRITVSGNRQLSSNEVGELLNGLHGESILWSDLKSWRLRLLESPWIKDAAFRRVLPSTVEVVVQERRPVGLSRIKGQLFLFDEEGTVIDRYGPAYADFDLPVVDGLTGRENDAADDALRAQLAAHVMAALRADTGIVDRLSQIDVSDPRNAGIILKGDTAEIFVGSDRILMRLQSYLQLSDRLRETVPVLDSVDLRFWPRVTVVPAGRAAAASLSLDSRTPGRAQAADRSTAPPPPERKPAAARRK